MRIPTCLTPRRTTGRTAGLVMVGALAAGLAACGGGAAASTSRPAPPDCAPNAPKITVEASGAASATPDTLTVDMGVQVSDPTASAALSDANGQASALTGSLVASGVAPGDVRSTDFSIVPTLTPSGRISGYQVSNALLVTLHDMADAGRVVDTAASSVGDAIRVNGIAFSVSNTGSVDGQARADAVTAAAAHAHSIARAAGTSLGGMCSVSDTTTGTEPLASAGAARDGPNAGSTLPVPLEPGTQQASAQVTVVYALGSR
jgi:uncharacterized protein